MHGQWHRLTGKGLLEHLTESAGLHVVKSGGSVEQALGTAAAELASGPAACASLLAACSVQCVRTGSVSQVKPSL